MPDVEFQNLRTGVSISGSLNFHNGEFIPDLLVSSRIPGDHTTRYQGIKGVSVSISIPPEIEVMDDDSKTQWILFTALERAHAVLASLSAKYQSYAYFNEPIECKYNGTTYVLHEYRFEELSFLRGLHISGGNAHCKDLAFLNKISSRQVHDFYREAQNEARPVDYRALQLWRFFEGWFKCQGWTLVNTLCALNTYQVFAGWNVTTNAIIWRVNTIRRSDISAYYRFYRCAIAHGGGSNGKRIIPRQGQSNMEIYLRMHTLLDIAKDQLRSKPFR